jgi:predicted nucleic acid-binding protein
MHRTSEIVINTGPILALSAATGKLDVLHTLYQRVVVPFEVAQEIEAGGAGALGVDAFRRATWLDTQHEPIPLPRFFSKSLDRGEAAVLQTALIHGISTVCIDEAMGRRAARLAGLAVTGSLGILIRAKREDQPIELAKAIAKMRAHGVWIGSSLERLVIELAQRQ